MITPLLLNLVLGLGCQTTVSTTETLLPQMVVSDANLDFGDVEWGQLVTRSLYVENQGELPMGLHQIKLEEEGFEENFSVTYYTETITCSDTSNSAMDVDDLQEKYGTDRGLNLEVDAQGIPTDFILNPGCRLNIDVSYSPSTYGDAYASFHIVSFIEAEDVEEDDEENSSVFKPLLYRDPIDFKETIILHGYSALGTGNIKVEPRTVDFGHLWTGEEETRQVMINNIGDGELVLGSPYLDSSCHPDEFTMDLATLDSDFKIPAGHGTIFEVDFTPTSPNTTYCSLHIPSNDVDSPDIEVRLKGNVGRDPSNRAPDVTLISPSVGYVHNSGDDLKVVLSMSDVNQPADTLFCKVKSMGQSIGTFSCNPNTASGYAEVDIPVDALIPGVDSLLVTVTDQSQLQGFASTTILFGTDFPASDDDGDGYGEEGDLIDCDDTDASVYPYAAEIPDGKDNDCDTVIDEKTTAGDDDGDSVTEEEGDCDDYDATVYPSAPEQPDLKDNDCDGIIDERTSLYDDDGDGFAEVDNDCNDRDPEIHPAMAEYCNGFDDNCNNLRDEQEPGGCLTLDSEPVIIGGIQMGTPAISVGESTTMSLFVHEVDGQDRTYLWDEDDALAATGHIAVSDPTASTITWTAPDEVDGEGQAFSVYVLIQDEDGNQAWVFDEISVYSTIIPESLSETSANEADGCSSSSALLPVLPFFLTGLFGGGIIWRRRRG